MPLLSVVLPTHNRAERLPAALDSVLAQTMNDLELIVVDDGSTDSTPDVLATATERDPRVRVIRRDLAGGAPGARNAGIRASAGEFIGFMDDDDQWLPNKAQVQIDYLNAHPTVAIASCFYDRVEEVSARTVPFKGPTTYSSNALQWANLPGSCSFVMLRRSNFPVEIVYDETLHDWDLWLRCSEKAPVVTIPEILCRYSWRETGQLSSPDRIPALTEAFVAKHADLLSSECKAFHLAKAHLLRASGMKRRALRAKYLVTLPGRARRAIFMTTLAARWGERRGDPGLGIRELVRVVDGR
jgi:glycosyltransferase involved in cell wall biosynthesis